MNTAARLALAPIVASLVITAAACSRGSKQPNVTTPIATATFARPAKPTPVNGAAAAGRAAVAQIGELNAGQYGDQYDELYPGQQALVPKDLFVMCEGQTPPHYDGVLVLGTTDINIKLLGVTDTVATEVTVETRRGTNKTSRAIDEVLVAGAWRWVLQDKAVQAYQSGTCP